MRKLVLCLVMAIVAFSSFAEGFHYKRGGDEWTYLDDKRTLLYETEFYGSAYACEYNIWTYDISEAEAWKIINGEEFPTFEFRRDEYKGYVYAYRIPARDYTNRVK